MIHAYTGIYRNIQEYTGIYRNIQEYTIQQGMESMDVLCACIDSGVAMAHDTTDVLRVRPLIN